LYLERDGLKLDYKELLIEDKHKQGFK
jgi:hypothetical protein